MEKVQRRAIGIIRGTEHLSYEKRLKESTLFRQEKTRLQEDVIATFQYLQGACWKAGEELFTRVCKDRTSDKGFKLR